MHSFSIVYSLYTVLELNPKTCANSIPTELHYLASVMQICIWWLIKLKLLCDWACESIGRVHA